MLLVGGRSSTGEDVAVSAPNPPNACGRLPDGPGRPRDTGQLADYTPVKLADFFLDLYGGFTYNFTANLAITNYHLPIFPS
jgi:hypothetical protein